MGNKRTSPTGPQEGTDSSPPRDRATLPARASDARQSARIRRDLRRAPTREEVQIRLTTGDAAPTASDSAALHTREVAGSNPAGPMDDQSPASGQLAIRCRALEFFASA